MDVITLISEVLRIC